MLGRPGVGKTTALREIARVLADDLGRRVMVIDTSNEIAGDGDIPHPAIGRARRLQVARPQLQHRVMIEAVENHMPEVIVIDEIGTEQEAHAARTIAERGVQLVATAHGNALANLVRNPTLSDLVGGVQAVTLGDDEARRRGTQKAVLERAAEPTFPLAVEMNSRSRWMVMAMSLPRLISCCGDSHRRLKSARSVLTVFWWWNARCCKGQGVARSSAPRWLSKWFRWRQRQRLQSARCECFAAALPRAWCCKQRATVVGPFSSPMSFCVLTLFWLAATNWAATPSCANVLVMELCPSMSSRLTVSPRCSVLWSGYCVAMEKLKSPRVFDVQRVVVAR